jgi:Xaa-Pro aminopeptidase
LIARRVASGEPVSELAVQQAILGHFASHSLTTYSPPNCSVNEHAGDPHYEPSPATDRPIKEGDLVLIDLWAKVDRPRAVYSDLTRMGYVGKTVPSKYQALFKIVADARDAAISCVEEAFAQKRTLRGFEVDDAARGVVESAGYGHYFVHRTGHSMAQEVHGNGAHMDNLETHEERLVLKRAGFTIEPGLYFPEFGLRSEINIHVDAQGKVHVTGGPAQTEILPILA